MMGLDTQDAQTDALVQLQKTLLDQRQNHARRAREHAINAARASGATVDEPLHAMMRDSHSRAVHARGGWESDVPRVPPTRQELHGGGEPDALQHAASVGRVVPRLLNTTVLS